MMAEPDVATGRKTYLLGLDLGQVTDWTALCVNEIETRLDGLVVHQTRHLERWRGDRYPAIVRDVRARVQALLGSPGSLPAHIRDRQRVRQPRVVLVVDHTGVGRPVVDMFEEADLGCLLVPVTITAGTTVTDANGEYHVPKRVLASTLQVVLQTERLKIRPQLALATHLQAEMKNFRVKINLLGRESYGAGADWREGNHDDLVLAEALACWAGESRITGGELVSVSGGLKDALNDWFEQ